MSDSSIAIVSSGGTLVDTRTNAGGDHRQVIVLADQMANDAIAVVTSSDAGVQTSEYGLVVRPLMTDAAKLRVSAILDNGSISAKSSDAGTFLVSAKQGDAALLRVSAFGPVSANQSISSLGLEGTAFLGQVSATLKAGTANIGYVSAFVDNGSVSAKSDDAGQVRVSASLFPDTVGRLTAFMSLSVSSAQSVKSSAGSLYGYYAFNKDTKVNFLKLYNLSAGLTVGTDVPVLTIPLPISGGANAWFGNGIAGFTAGIQMAATSGLPVDNTTAPAASAVIVNLFYK